MTGAFVIRALLSGVIIALIAVIGKKAPAAGALIASLPLISIMGMIWLWRDTGDRTLLANHAEATFFFVIPSLPMFLLIPWLLRSGNGFWVSIGLGIVLTIVLYLLTATLAARFGIRI
jgi:hypothetical protein